MSKRIKKKDLQSHPYPYLSINQPNKVHTNKNFDPYASLDCLNIKLDKKGNLRQNQLNSFKSKILAPSRQNKNTISHLEQQKELPRIQMKKTIINPQQILPAATAKVHRQLHRQDQILHKRRSSSNQSKKQGFSKEDQQDKSNGKNTVNMGKHFSFHQTAQLVRTKPKKYFFKKMLKKCDKLLEISKFQSELMNTIQTNQSSGLRICSEPISLVEYKPAYQTKIIDVKIKEGINLNMAVNLQRLELMKMKPGDFIENKTVEIKKYSNELQKIKGIFRKQLTRQEISKPKGIMSLPKQVSNKKSEVFGPWDAINQSFCLSRD